MANFTRVFQSLSANTMMAKLTNNFQRTKFITSSTDKCYLLDSEDDFRSGCRNVSRKQQFFFRTTLTRSITQYKLTWSATMQKY